MRWRKRKNKKTEGGFTFDVVKMQTRKNNSEDCNQSSESNPTGRENGLRVSTHKKKICRKELKKG